jgi:hypothetical protein
MHCLGYDIGIGGNVEKNIFLATVQVKTNTLKYKYSVFSDSRKTYSITTLAIRIVIFTINTPQLNYL